MQYVAELGKQKADLFSKICTEFEKNETQLGRVRIGQRRCVPSEADSRQRLRTPVPPSLTGISSIWVRMWMRLWEFGWGFRRWRPTT